MGLEKLAIATVTDQLVSYSAAKWLNVDERNKSRS